MPHGMISTAGHCPFVQIPDPSMSNPKKVLDIQGFVVTGGGSYPRQLTALELADWPPGRGESTTLRDGPRAISAFFTAYPYPAYPHRFLVLQRRVVCNRPLHFLQKLQTPAEQMPAGNRIT